MSAAALQRAERLLRWYPREWRARYGEEFVALLVDDLQERPRSLQRSLDVAGNGFVARLAVVGLGGHCLDPDDNGRRSLAAFACAVSFFVTVAIALWAQITIGWQWSAPNTTATTLAMVVMSLAVAAIGVASITSSGPVVWLALRSLDGRQRWRTLRPLTLIVIGLTVFVVGTHHFANGWPGTGGHPWAHQGIVPGGVAAYAWASTLFISSYWLHPAALGAFPGAEVAWMFACPLALGAVIVGVTKLVRRLEFADRLLRFERTLGFVVAGAMALFLTGAALWILDGGPGPRDLFHIGAIDVTELVILVTSLALAGRAVERSRDAARTAACR
ncbi:MAG TPA: hypothetical protein VH012_03485 [Acidimicrobiales bacterium]|jgi:hypothetical protein|nr:hypothetical protein [Acidimicrobiales bacterium]